MKDDVYSKLLKEVKSRLSSSLQTYDVSAAYTQLELEMNRVKDILISSGHDLKDVKEFTSDIQTYINDSMPR